MMMEHAKLVSHHLHWNLTVKDNVILVQSLTVITALLPNQKFAFHAYLDTQLSLMELVKLFVQQTFV